MRRTSLWNLSGSPQSGKVGGGRERADARLYAAGKEPDTEGIFHVNVPRQYDSSLILRVAEDDRSLRDFAIGEYLEEGGYDWTARELADVELVIDYAKADLTLTVEDWEVSFGFNVVI